jgi:hypothetical protein
LLAGERQTDLVDILRLSLESKVTGMGRRRNYNYSLKETGEIHHQASPYGTIANQLIGSILHVAIKGRRQNATD